MKQSDRTQQDLFGMPPRSVDARDLEIVKSGSAPLSKEQIALNKLIRRVNTLRAKLAEWAAFEPRRLSK